MINNNGMRPHRGTARGEKEIGFVVPAHTKIS